MTAFKAGDPLTLNRLYGRSTGHKLRGSQQELVDKLLPEIAVPDEGEVTSVGLFGEDRPLHFEIGFGSGEHLADRAANVRLWRGDALEVLQRVPNGALTFLYLLHPDPWPKSRHAKRRMVNDGPVDLFASKLRAGGEFRLATDDPTYLAWSLMVMQRHAHQFEWLAQSPADFLEAPGGWIETRYGAKSRREGRRPYYLRYRRAR